MTEDELMSMPATRTPFKYKGYDTVIIPSASGGWVELNRADGESVDSFSSRCTKEIVS